MHHAARQIARLMRCADRGRLQGELRALGLSVRPLRRGQQSDTSTGPAGTLSSSRGDSGAVGRMGERCARRAGGSTSPTAHYQPMHVLMGHSVPPPAENRLSTVWPALARSAALPMMADSIVHNRSERLDGARDGAQIDGEGSESEQAVPLSLVPIHAANPARPPKATHGSDVSSLQPHRSPFAIGSSSSGQARTFQHISQANGHGRAPKAVMPAHEASFSSKAAVSAADPKHGSDSSNWAKVRPTTQCS